MVYVTWKGRSLAGANPTRLVVTYCRYYDRHSRGDLHFSRCQWLWIWRRVNQFQTANNTASVLDVVTTTYIMSCARQPIAPPNRIIMYPWELNVPCQLCCRRTMSHGRIYIKDSLDLSWPDRDIQLLYVLPTLLDRSTFHRHQGITVSSRNTPWRKPSKNLGNNICRSLMIKFKVVFVSFELASL